MTEPLDLAPYLIANGERVRERRARAILSKRAASASARARFLRDPLVMGRVG